MMAEAGRDKPGQAIQASSSQAEGIGRTGGNMVGGAISGASRGVKNVMDKVRDWWNRRSTNRNLPPGSSKC